MQIVLLILALLANIPIAVVIGWVMFGSWSDFGESLFLTLTYAPWHDWDLDEIQSQRRFWASFKVTCFLITVAAALYGEYVVVKALAPGWVGSL